MSILGWSLGAEALGYTTRETAGRCWPGIRYGALVGMIGSGPIDVGDLPGRQMRTLQKGAVDPTNMLGSMDGSAAARAAGGRFEWRRFLRALALADGDIAGTEAYRECSIQPRFHMHDAAPQSGTDILSGDLILLALELEGVIVGHRARLHQAENRG